jgi:hypothetical protein
MNSAGIEQKDLPIPLEPHQLEQINAVIDQNDIYRNTIGNLLQFVGQLFRKIVPDYWILALEKKINPEDHIIIEDLRYPNEFEWIRDNLGVNCRISNNKAVADNRDPLHISETALDACTAWDFTLDNSGDLNTVMSDLAKKLNVYCA